MKKSVAGGGGAVVAEAPAPPDWSRLLDDMLVLVMQALAIPDLLSTGAVCSSWRPAYSAVRRIRLPIADASPCLLYSCASDAPDTATIRSLSSNATFKVRLPDPPFRSRHLVGSAHGWIVAADETSNLHALNPLKGAQVDLPPATGLYHIERFVDEQGNLMYNHHYDSVGDPEPLAYRPEELRLYLYHRVAMSCSPSAGRRCVVLLLHRPDGQLSFARPGDDRWTRITGLGFRDLHDAVYNSKDGLFYVVAGDGCIFTLDLSGPLQAARKILPKFATYDMIKYIALTPRDDIFQVWRDADCRPSGNGTYDEYGDEATEAFTFEMELYMVDIGGQKAARTTCLEGYAVFMGFNSTIFVSTQDFPALNQDCAYFTDDKICLHTFEKRDLGMWNFKSGAPGTIGDVQAQHPWLNFPPPMWLTPTLG